MTRSTDFSGVAESPGGTDGDRREWVVEFNFAGCRVLRWAEKRRHLLAPGSFGAPQLTVRHGDAL